MNPFESVGTAQLSIHIRHYMTRKELFLRALRIQKRLEELKQIHNWDMGDLSLVVDELMPMNLHSAGANGL